MSASTPMAALALVVLFLAGCSGSNKDPGSTSPPNERQFELSKTETVHGPLNLTWSWTVRDTQYASYSIRLNLSAPEGSQEWSATKLNVALSDGARTTATPANDATFKGPKQTLLNCETHGPTFDCHQIKGPTATGTWTLKVNATESSLRYDVQVRLLY